MRSVLLLCRSFQSNLHVIIHLAEMHMLWLRLLGLIEAFKHRIRAPQRDPVTADVVLTLKAMLQAMHADPAFQRVQQASGQDMWVLTATVLETFCPDLKSELMPTGSTPNKPARCAAPAPSTPRRLSAPLRAPGPRPEPAQSSSADPPVTAYAAAPAGTVLRPRPRLSGARLRTTSGHRAHNRTGQLVRGARLGKRAQRRQ